jgi:hypothetical protein
MNQESKFYRLRAEEVLALIREQELKRYWVAEVAGVHKTTLRRWLNGRISKVHERNVTRLAEVLTADPARIAVRIHPCSQPLSSPEARP